MAISKRRTAEDEKLEAQREERLRDSGEATDDLDAALEDTFPASDPPSMTQPSTRAGAPNHVKPARKPSDTKKRD